MTALTDWINGVNTTSLRILVSITLAAELILSLQFAMLALAWSPTPAQKWVLLGIGGGILTMMGFDVIQFASKRFSDSGYAKNANPAPVGTPVAP
jgi:hypothetical protein